MAQTGDELERLSIALNHMVQRLDEAFQYSRRFVADASHELRTPLTVLRGELESFVQEPQPAARVARAARQRAGGSRAPGQHRRRAVCHLAARCRGGRRPNGCKFDLARLAAATADQMSLLAEDKNIEVTCAAAEAGLGRRRPGALKAGGGEPARQCDQIHLQGGAVALTVSAIDSKAVLEVADNGIGIPAEALPRVFDRFFRVDKARSRELGGAGLGLSIVKSICAAHHGRVEASSTPGQGSRFRVELPLASAPPDHPKKRIMSTDNLPPQQPAATPLPERSKARPRSTCRRDACSTTACPGAAAELQSRSPASSGYTQTRASPAAGLPAADRLANRRAGAGRRPFDSSLAGGKRPRQAPVSAGASSRGLAGPRGACDAPGPLQRSDLSRRNSGPTWKSSCMRRSRDMCAR